MERKINLPQEYINRIVDCIIQAVPTDSVYIFGSYARGEETDESDLDLYVITNDEEENRFIRAGRVGYSLLWMDMPKDILLGSRERFNARRNSLADIEYTVFREGVKIYG